MGPLMLAGLGAGLGFLKGQLVDRPREAADRRVAAETIRYSPWTGMRPAEIRQADTFGSMLQGGMTGASIGQGLEAQELYKAELVKQAALRQAAMSPVAMNTNAWLSMNPYA